MREAGVAAAGAAMLAGVPALGQAKEKKPAQQNQPAENVKPQQQPKPVQETAQQYEHPPGVFINRPLTQVSKAADTMLEEMESRAVMYFWEQASPKTGLVLDRAPAVGKTVSRVASIAATGFGLSALCIAAERKYLRPVEVEARVEKTLAFLLNDCPHEHGFLYHFIEIESGKRLFNCELSSIDTALLLCGILLCREYFTGNKRIQALATTLYRRVDWQWMLNDGPTLSMGWMPEQGFLKHRWDIYAELMTMYLMAIGSPTHPLPPSTWDALQRPVLQYGGIDYISGVAPIFIHQYAHAWCDYRDIRDKHANYFTNSIAATRAHQLFCLTLGNKFPWINQDLWGITASDSRSGYRVWGGPPAIGRIDGTVVPAATAGSLVFLPSETSHVLLSMRQRYGDKIWTRYGFVDAFNPDANWYAEDLIGIDVGISLMMAENLRTGFVWKHFMKAREINHAMQLVSFHADPDTNSQVL